MHLQLATLQIHTTRKKTTLQLSSDGFMSDIARTEKLIVMIRIQEGHTDHLITELK